MAVRHHIKVLVVDCDSTHASQLEAVLNEHGFSAAVCTDVPSARVKIESESHQIAVIDVSAKLAGAYELMALFKRVDNRNAVIAMRQNPDLESAIEAMRHGAGEYLRKPVSKDTLIPSLERVCRMLGLVHTNEDELNRLIGQRIRAERLRQNLTLRQLSERTDLTTSQLSQVELGKNAASIWALARISNALGKQMSSMLEGL